MHAVAMLPNGRGGLYRGRISVASGRIVAIEPAPAGRDEIGPNFDFTPHVALPGFIDLQLNGAFGYDITTDPSRMWLIGERLLGHGVTAFLPTIITCPPQHRRAAYGEIRSRPHRYKGAEPLGLHIEGPELAPDYAGTHPRDDLARGTEGMASEFLREADVVAMVTVAPEVESASKSVTQLVEAGIVVSLGHTAATAGQTVSALDSGASALTHIFNGMGPIHHREVGAVGAGLLDPRAYISLIADGHHLSDEAVEIAWRLAGPRRIFLVTDAMAGMGAPAGTYRIGSKIVQCGDAARNSDGVLAGSLLTMPETARRMRETTGATWDEIAAITSTNQAEMLDDADRGQLLPGRRADIAVVDAQLQPVATFLEGNLVYRRPERIRVAETASPAAIGVDIGGTAFKAALFDGSGLGQVRTGATGRDKPAPEVLAEVKKAVEDIMRTAGDIDIRGIGIGCTGIVDDATGVVVEAANLGWRNIDVAAVVGEGLRLPVVLEHDVYLAALAEWETGSGVQAASMLYVSVGTGVAARLFTGTGTDRGSAQLAGELGFLPVGSDSRALESISSGQAISDAYRHETGLVATAEQIAASLLHDSAAATVWTDAVNALAHGLAAAICLEDPQIVVVGGGVSNAGRVLLDALEDPLAALLEPLRDPPSVVVAAHGDRSGIVGAALHGGKRTASER